MLVLSTLFLEITMPHRSFLDHYRNINLKYNPHIFNHSWNYLISTEIILMRNFVSPLKLLLHEKCILLYKHDLKCPALANNYKLFNRILGQVLRVILSFEKESSQMLSVISTSCSRGTSGTWIVPRPSHRYSIRTILSKTDDFCKWLLSITGLTWYYSCCDMIV